MGLTLILPEQDLVLCRYNGANHTHRNRIENTKLGFGHYIHVATARYITADMDPDGFAEPTDRFQDAFSALACMVTDCCLGDILPPPSCRPRYS